MSAKQLNISVVDYESKWDGEWYEDVGFILTLYKLLTSKNFMQCTYRGITMICSRKGKAIFDSNGKLYKLYDYSEVGILNNKGDSKCTHSEIKKIIQALQKCKNVAGLYEYKNLELEMNECFAMVEE